MRGEKIGMVKVSIIVPVYNVEKYIRKCLESLVNQTLEDIEIIVVNDGSTDNSQNIIDEYASKFPHLLKSFIKKNGGLSDARNYGLSYCNGEYIGFVDSDDYIDIKMYEKMYSKAKDENSDIVVCDYNKVYNRKMKLVRAKKYVDKKNMFIDTLAAAWNKIYRREMIMKSGVIFPKGLIYEDTEFFCKLIPYIKVASYVSEPFVYYIQRRGSIANTQGEKNAHIFRILENIINYYKENGLFKEYYSELEYLYIRIMLGSSMERICRIKDKKIRNELLKKTYDLIYKNFPNWKRNLYLNKIKSKRHLYMKSISKNNIYIFARIFNILFLLKENGLYRE
ncbi:glycosyltransferase family 2 protein [Clostridium nigeriense]|uniref:glycosyltransferase family 2 protein n=1 Tax=Clostridium nigeriense TaxID=1805470 RepID=UPI003D349C45